MIPIQPKDIDIELPGGGTKKFQISKFDCISGREIVAGYPLTGLPKIGEYKSNEEIMLKLMSHVGAYTEAGTVIYMTTRELVRNHVPDFETLMKLEWAELEYNVSFFGNGGISNFFEIIAKKFQALTTETLTSSLQQLSRKKGRPSKN